MENSDIETRLNAIEAKLDALLEKKTAKVAPVNPFGKAYEWTPGADAKTPEEIEAFFGSPEISRIKSQMCDIGRRIWAKDFVDGNGGNITVRVGDDLVLCTPTLVSKGFMKPEDICLIDFAGNQLAGTRRRTSEAMTHLEVLKRVPNARACVHAHPPHATAFAISNEVPAKGIIPEAEIFVGSIGIAEYQTPGAPELAETVAECARGHQAVIMKNHGVLCWGKNAEDAYWRVEILDAYCHTLAIALQLGRGLCEIRPEKVRELERIRAALIK